MVDGLCVVCLSPMDTKPLPLSDYTLLQGLLEACGQGRLLCSLPLPQCGDCCGGMDLLPGLVHFLLPTSMSHDLILCSG